MCQFTFQLVGIFVSLTDNTGCVLIQQAMFTLDAWRHDYHLSCLLQCRTWSISTLSSIIQNWWLGWYWQREQVLRESPVWLPLCLPHTSHALTCYHTLASPVTCPQQTTLVMGHVHACKSCHAVHFHHFLYIHHLN